MAVNPDIVYLRSREDLLQYEESRLNSLINGMANYYTTRNDQSLFGNILRALARELAKMEYGYAYDLVNKEPQFLTPPDIRRRWADPLFVSRNYPASGQSDLAFRQMLVDLLIAYKEGATVKAIHDVILAYTGKSIVVEELYKEIGKFFDESDRNAITVSVNVGGTNPLADIQNLVQLQAVTRDLYGAIDVTKPAHVGINFTTVFEVSVDEIITGIQDQLRIFVSLVEDEPFDPMLIQAPVLDPLNPKTTIAAYGLKFLKKLTPTQYAALIVPSLPVWQANHSYSVGDVVLDVGTGWSIQTVVTAGTSGASEPTFNPTLFGTKAEGPDTLVWSNTAPTAKAAYSLLAGNYNLKNAAKNWIMLLVPGSSTPSGVLANYDPAHPAGLLAPRLDRAWEIGGGDQPFIFELT